MDKTTKIYQTINDVSKKVNSARKAVDGHIAENAEAAADAQNAIIEAERDISEQLADIENALCELTTE